MHRFAGPLVDFGLSRREQVEDVMQESFSKAYFALGDYQGGYDASFAAWLTRITVHTCYDELRRQRRSAIVWW